MAPCRGDDLAAFERIVIEHQRQVYRTALRLLGKPEDAEDAAQEVFVRLHRYLPRFDNSRDLAPWLYRMTVNVCRDIGGRRARANFEELPEDIADSGAAPDADLIAAQRRRILADGLKRLGEKERAAVVLRDIEGLPTSEVARILGSSEATVRSQISAARLKIRRFAERLTRRPK
jgi:RNA polymerase sigma-70 factor (ECF subfamily)